MCIRDSLPDIPHQLFHDTGRRIILTQHCKTFFQHICSRFFPLRLLPFRFYLLHTLIQNQVQLLPAHRLQKVIHRTEPERPSGAVSYTHLDVYKRQALLLKAVASVFIHKNINISAELDLLGIFRTAEFKRIAVGQPVVRQDVYKRQQLYRIIFDRFSVSRTMESTSSIWAIQSILSRVLYRK